ncbi:MAG: acyl-CoA dehydrogenase family protein [Sandaracinaceae bacterium]
MIERLPREYLDDETIAAAWTGADQLAEAGAAIEAEHPDKDQALRAMVRLLGERGLLKLIVDGPEGGRFDKVRWRAVCLARERLGHASALLELAFAMQGLGSYPITLSGSAALKQRWLPKVRSGEAVAGFAITEPEAGSDLSRIETSARVVGDHYVLDGRKIFISNATVGDVFTVFAAVAPKSERHWLSAFVVPGDAPGLTRIPQRVLGGHPIGELVLDGVRVPKENLIGADGEGMRAALGTLHRFRVTVGAAAVGFAQRALDEAVAHTSTRRQFGAPLSQLQAVQMSLAERACDVEAARLLVYRAAKLADEGAGREAEAYAASMAKLTATESAQRVIDRAVQLFGGRGVLLDNVVARLYEDVRSLRIYEGASDVQRTLIARHLLDMHKRS